MDCLHENRAIATRAHPPGRHGAAARRVAIFRQRARRVARRVAILGLALVGAVHAASNVVEYTHDAAGNIVAIRRANPAPIAIAGFAPTSGPIGTVVTITGTGFAGTPSGNAVTFNGVPATVAAATPSALTVAVPAGTGSGRIRIATGAGSAVGAADFVVPPGAIAAADIIATTRIAASGQAQSVSLHAPGKYGLVLFDGGAGDWLSLHPGNCTVNPAGATIAYRIYKPDNTRLQSGTVSTANLSTHLPKLPAAGTYALLLDAGIAQVSLDARRETNAFVPAGGTTALRIPDARQSARMLIAAVAGDQRALLVSALATVPANDNLDCAIATPSGSSFRMGGISGLGATVQLPPFAATGTHPVIFKAGAAATQADFRVGLLAGISLPVDGAPVDLAIANPGDGAR